MNNTMNLLLRAAIAAAASDREKFVDRVSSLIEEKTGASPEKAETIAGNIDKLVDMLDQHLLFEQLTGYAKENHSPELEKKIDQLTEAINKLNVNLEKIVK